MEERETLHSALHRSIQEKQTAKDEVKKVNKNAHAKLLFQVLSDRVSSILNTTSSLQDQLEVEKRTTETHHKRLTDIETNIIDMETNITDMETNITNMDSPKLTKKIDELEKNDVEVQMKLQNLESADIFIQEAHR